MSEHTICRAVFILSMSAVLCAGLKPSITHAAQGAKNAPHKAAAPAPKPTPVGPPPVTEMMHDTLLQAKLFDLDDKSKVLYTYAHISRMEGERRNVENTYFDPEGKQVVVEHAQLGDNGRKLLNYRLEQRQIGLDANVIVQMGVAEFKATQDGKTKTNRETVGDDFVAGPNLMPFLFSNWSKLMSGEMIKARFAVLDRAETVEFKYYKDKEADVNGKKAVVIVMKPASLMISAFVKPLRFYMTPDGLTLLQWEGRVLPKIKKGEKWKDLEALTVYQ